MDKIKLSGIEFFAHHGVLQSEKDLGQIFFADCEVFLDTSQCNDDLRKTVNYAELASEIVSFSQKNRYNLLETLANNLAKHILTKYPIIEEITLTVHKPHAPIPVKFEDVILTVARGWKICYLAVGSNLGDRHENLDLAWHEIENSKEIQGLAKSDYIETKPYGVIDQPDFLNGAIKIRTFLTPMELLSFCKETERKAGRVKTRRWGERTLDVDILMYGDTVLFTDELKIPHPEMHKRDFVLKPLCQIEPYLIHPVKRMNVSELFALLNEGEKE